MIALRLRGTLMQTLDATRLLVFSGAAAMLFSSLLGFAMLVPMQPWGAQLLKGVNLKQVGAAHLDWIMLGLMQGLAAGVVAAFALSPPDTAVWAMIAGGWMNPIPYIFRAFGVNAFAFGGGPLQWFAASLGAVSVTFVLYAWFWLLIAAWETWP